MLIRILFFFVAGLLKLRYRIRLHGLETIPRKNAKGILFLPNHPAMVDPPIVGSVLVPRFRPWILVNAAQVQATVLKYAVNCLKLLPVPDVGVFGRDAMALVEKKITACAEALDRGENVLIYPAGHTYHCRYEDLKGNMGVHLLLKQCPDTRVVLLRTVGLWGSSFSKSSGGDPEFRDTILANIRHLLENLIFFGPRRHVDITFYEASDIPRSGTKEELNRYLENFYNQVAPGNTYVPYTWWERGGVRVLPEPTGDEEADVSCVPPEIREKVLAKLRETASVNEVNDRDLLGADLGMDSLMIYELSVWIQQEFGENVSSPDTLRRAEDVMLGAMGLKKTRLTLNPVPPEWFQPPNDAIVKIPEGCGKITETFLYWAARNPDYPILADQTVGILSNRKIILVIMVLQKTFAGLPGERVGIIMPACAPFFLIYMALLFAGKTPVLLNWTSGSRNMASCVRKAGLQATISSKRVITELESRGIDFSGIREKMVFLEDITQNISPFRKLLSLFRARFCWRVLRSARVSETAAVLFTSGSESEPKAVPLTHRNCMADLDSTVRSLNLHRDNCILGMLPPFHSFGLLIGAMAPAAGNVQIVFHPNPTEGAVLSRLIAAYRATMIVGTPTFAGGILSRGTAEELKSVRLIITGAEKCPQKVLDLCRERCPQACFLEGYGITECSPIVALNTPGASKPGTIGRILTCLDWKICDESGAVLPPGKTGMLFVSGPSVFEGYLAYDGPSPFEEKDGRKWYRTGDLAEADEDGFITFRGRLRRFIKVAGEMVSLPAVEEVLQKRFPKEKDAVSLAVEAGGTDDAPEIVLFATFAIDKKEANRAIREAGFSPIHYIVETVQLEEIPLLGTGKTDYRKLKKMAGEMRK